MTGTIGSTLQKLQKKLEISGGMFRVICFHRPGKTIHPDPFDFHALQNIVSLFNLDIWIGSRQHTNMNNVFLQLR